MLIIQLINKLNNKSKNKFKYYNSKLIRKKQKHKIKINKLIKIFKILIQFFILIFY